VTSSRPHRQSFQVLRCHPPEAPQHPKLLSGSMTLC
jgi:hypothetical protein